MKHFFAILFGFFITTNSFAQTVIIDENFSDGNFTDNPSWTDSESKYIVNSADFLQLDAPSESGEAIITTSSNAVYGKWEAFIRLDFNPSGSNLSRFYILSGSQNMQGAVNGYYIEIGSSDDEISLYRQDGTTSTKIIDGTDDLVNSDPVGVRIRVTRDLDGNWELLADPNGETSFISQGTATDHTHTQSNYIGLFSDYTSTRSDLFEYDDIRVTKINPPLKLEDVTVVDNQTIDVTFNIDVDAASISVSDFLIENNIGNPNTTTLPSTNVVRLNYDSPIPSGQYTLTVNEVDDTDGNTIESTSIPFNIFGSFEQGDVIINEFAYDPPTNVGEEYIEIKNTSDKYLNIAEWQIADNHSSSLLGNNPIPLKPDSFLVISADTTELYQFFGDRSYHEADFPALNNTTDDAVQLITNSGIIADSLTYSSDWGGTDIALERRSASTPSIYQENWGDSPNPNGGTPGAPNDVTPDNTPPALTTLNILSSHTIQLVFDERLNQAGNYDLNNANVASVNQPAAETVELTLSMDLQNAEEYSLTIADIRDIFGNTTGIDTTFTYYELSDVGAGDVVINEFNYDPISGSTEYVEIYNPTEKSYSMEGWTLSDNRGIRSVITTQRHILPPDSFAVIAPDNTLLTDPHLPLIAMGNTFPALNNSGDKIVVRAPKGILLDSLQYTSAWGGQEVALERRNPSVSATFSDNWEESPNSFGTPGRANEVDPDKTPPVLKELYSIDNSTLQLVFSERITSTSSTDRDHYSIVPNRGIQLISTQDDSTKLFLSKPMNSGTTYKLTVSNIDDIFGNTLNSATKTIEFLEIKEAQPGDIVINEILYNPGASGKADFIELYNTSSKNFDLNNWTVGDASSETSINQNLKFRAGDYLVLTGNRPFANSVANGTAIEGFPSLNITIPDDIYLRSKKGDTIDSLRYSQTWGGSTEGTSLERKDPEAASNDASNWQANPDGKSSHGQRNISFNTDEKPPKVIFSKINSDGTYEVQFNEFIQLTNDLIFQAGDQPLKIVSFDSTSGNIITLESPYAKTRTINDSTIAVKNLTDVKGNATAQSQIAISQPMDPTKTDLVINEIMYNPLSEPDDNQPDQGEYIELKNTRDYAISLEGIVLHDEPDENGNIRSLKPVVSSAKWVPAKEQVLIHADPAAKFQNSRTADFFEINPSPVQSIMRIDRTTLSLASTDDAIYVADSTGATIDSVFYDESWQNPNVIDTRGIALERISPGGPSDDDTNWGSSVNAKGGTPNSENSIYQEDVQAPRETGISFTPNPFSPDDDGNNDNLFINYKLDHQDYLMKVHIYDRYGRLVRELADGEQAGFEGQLIWDGRKNDGGRNRIGIYIVVFEAYDSSSGADKAFKKTVVLARRLH